VDAFDGLDLFGIVTKLQADDDFPVLLVGQLVGFHHAAVARGIDADRLFHEHVFAGLDRRLVLHGAKAGWSRQQHQVHLGGDGVLVGLQTYENAILGDVHPIGVARPQSLQGGSGPVLEGVGHGEQLEVVRHVQTVGCGPAAASAASDQGDLNLVAAGGVRAAGRAQRAGRHSPGHRQCGTLQEVPSREPACVAHGHAP
jgi:hypothetical protein